MASTGEAGRAGAMGVSMRMTGHADLTLSGLIAIVSTATGALNVSTNPQNRNGWIDRAALLDPDEGPLSDLIERLIAAGFGANRRAVSASLLLRQGWAAGPIIAAHLVAGRVLRIEDFSLRFSGATLVESVWIRQADAWQPSTTRGLRAGTLKSLLLFSEPLLDSQSAWSGYSRHALWSMLASSWLAQFAAIGERLGRRRQAVHEARVMLGNHSELARALPDTYEMACGKRSEFCQVLKACCLSYKGYRHSFCASCPLVPNQERFLRNREWVCRNR